MFTYSIATLDGKHYKRFTPLCRALMIKHGGTTTAGGLKNLRVYGDSSTRERLLLATYSKDESGNLIKVA